MKPSKQSRWAVDCKGKAALVEVEEHSRSMSAYSNSFQLTTCGTRIRLFNNAFDNHVILVVDVDEYDEEAEKSTATVHRMSRICWIL